ncbi:alpha/beta fold hydrolase [Microvirga thermotolerans]|uniref:Alpha/beta fold hydrolase n=1 Tax=Microvirga thermotolerans TaxID=2651334 RepID=A0A5P9JUF7_9HYPH|nr:alpha/beta hydrolase [Microvirga thermotolerans]QFU15751.1 alpha/beta fold hydrolase [Microvirga thermotolerans]
MRDRPQTGYSRAPSVPVRNGAAAGPAWLVPAVLGGAALGAAALYALKQTADAEREHPPVGRFMNVDGVRLHYVERGRGQPLVLLHGNGSLLQDFLISGIVDRLAKNYRVIVFDRPGFGYSSRPRRLWTPRAYARLFAQALDLLNVESALVLGHSWGTLIALSLALEEPALVRGLVLLSGYYYPTARADVVLFSPPAIPVFGDLLRHTVEPLLAKAILPKLIRKIFAPAPVPRRFEERFPRSLVLRPSQLRAIAEDTALMIPAAMDLQSRYGEIAVPAVIMAGDADEIVDPGRQSERLQRDLPNSVYMALPGLGHMIQHLDPEAVVQAVDGAAQRARVRPRVAAPGRAAQPSAA